MRLPGFVLRLHPARDLGPSLPGALLHWTPTSLRQGLTEDKLTADSVGLQVVAVLLVRTEPGALSMLRTCSATEQCY